MNGSSVWARMSSVTVSKAGLFVAVGRSFTGQIVYATSTDGSTWTTPAIMNGYPNDYGILSLTVNSSGLFVAVGWDSNTSYPFATYSY